MVLSVLSDLSVQASGRVTKNSTQGRRPSLLFLVTRPEVRTDKFDNTRKNHVLIVLLYYGFLRMHICTDLNVLLTHI